MHNHPSLGSPQIDVCRIFWKVYKKSANMKITKESFQVTGLNPDVYPNEDFLPSEVMNRPQKTLKEDTPGETGKELQVSVSVEKETAVGCTYSDSL